ncbi:MAG: hypothetical protein OXF07_05575 [Rhodobacter sp.]|nr:hypothetical protein [Rhodobacter sp.]MCY4167298.1 hypothetical protein [Rhodobacter sp.]MCY4243413.1 hypothetical protein [Rhodobacter sp.]
MNFRVTFPVHVLIVVGMMIKGHIASQRMRRADIPLAPLLLSRL